MHETVIAQAVVRAVRAAMEARGAVGVSTIDLEVGELEGLTPPDLQAAFDLEAAGTPLEGAVLQVARARARAYCPSCDEERPLELPTAASHEIPRVACPECGAQLEFRGGRGFTVRRAEMVVEDP